MPPLKTRTCFSKLNGKTKLCESKTVLYLLFDLPANGLRYLRWGGDGEAVQLEK
jgi:hypothetical protein